MENSIGNAGKPTIAKQIVYGVQIVLIFIVVIFCLVNLTIHQLPDPNEKLWIGLLGSCVGYILPNPKLKIP